MTQQWVKYYKLMINQLEKQMPYRCRVTSIISIYKDDRKCKNKADRKMVKGLDNVPYNERQWGHWRARNMTNTEQKLQS